MRSSKFNNSLSHLDDRLRLATAFTPPSEIQRLLNEILTTELARNGVQRLVDEYNNPNWFVFLWQQLLGVPYRRGGPTSSLPTAAVISSDAAEHFFSLIFPLFHHAQVTQVGSSINPDWQAAADRLNRTVVPQFTTPGVVNVLDLTTVDHHLLNAILGLLFLLFPGGPANKRWVLFLLYNEESMKFLSSILWRYAVMLFLFTRSACCYGVVLSVFSLLSYMMGLYFLSILSFFIEDEKLESHLEGFKSFLIWFIMLVTEIPLWILAFTFVFFRTPLKKMKERVKKSSLNIKDQFNFFLTGNLNKLTSYLNKLEERGREDYEAEISFCL